MPAAFWIVRILTDLRYTAAEKVTEEIFLLLPDPSNAS